MAGFLASFVHRLSPSLAAAMPGGLGSLGCGPDYGLLDAPGGRTKASPCTGWVCDKTDIDTWAAQSTAAHAMVIDGWNRLMQAENAVGNWVYTTELESSVNAYEAAYRQLPDAGFLDRLGGSEYAVAQHIANIELARCRIQELRQALAKVSPETDGGSSSKSGIWSGWIWIAGGVAAASMVTVGVLVVKPDLLHARN